MAEVSPQQTKQKNQSNSRLLWFELEMFLNYGLVGETKNTV
jgi:hypothetical protein